MGLWYRAKKTAQVLFVGSIAAYLGWLGFKEQPVDRVPEQGLVRQIQREQELVRKRRERAAIALVPTAVSPDGRRVACVGSLLQYPPAPDIYVYTLSDKSLENITNSVEAELDARWLDNERLKYFTGSGWQWKNTRTGETGSVPPRGMPYGLLLGGLFGLPLAAMVGIGLYRRRRKEPLMHAASRNADLIAGTSFLTGAATIAAGDALIRAYYPELCNDIRLSYLWMAAGMAVVSGLVPCMAAMVKPPRIRNYVKRTLASRRVVFGSYETQLDAIEKIRDIIPHPEELELTRAVVELQHHHLDEGFLALQRGLASLPALADAPDMRLPLAPLVGQMNAALRRRNSASRLTSSLVSLFSSDFPAAFRELDAFVSKEPSLDFMAAHALYAQSVADAWPEFSRIAPDEAHAFERECSLEELTGHSWHRVIEHILRDREREHNFTVIGEFRNEVLERVSSQFLKGLLKFKRCDTEHAVRLARERKHVLALREVYGDRIVQSLALTEHDGKCYHIMRHIDGITLEKLLQEGTREQQAYFLADATSLLADIHRYTPADRKPVPQGSWHYNDRLVTTFCDELKKAGIAVPAGVYAALEGASKAVFEGLRDAPVGFYKDANPRNWLVEKGKGKEKGRVVAIDFEHSVMMPVYFDLVSLLEFGPSPADELLRLDMLKQYYETAKPRNAAGMRIDEDTFMAQYEYAALQRHLELAGYCARDNVQGAIIYHVNRARHYARGLGQTALVEALAGINL